MENIDKEKLIATKLKEIYDIMNIDIHDGNIDTPKRVAKMWVNEIFRNDNQQLDDKALKDTIKLFKNNGQSGMIITTTPFHAFCEHHLLPFSGKIILGYVPNEKIIGLSKIPRIVDFWCHTPQLQEKLTNDILTTFKKYVKPDFVVVRAIAEHTCVACRGIERDCQTDTVSYWGENPTDNKDNLNEFYMRVGDSIWA